jgi:ferredoxin
LVVPVRFINEALDMAKITVVHGPEIDAPNDKRLILALEDAGIDILHRCGGLARCTTCRVIIPTGEPQRMTVAEKEKLIEGGHLGRFRLSCQILCDHDMTVEPMLSKKGENLDDAGPRPTDHITPHPEWTHKS